MTLFLGLNIPASNNVGRKWYASAGFVGDRRQCSYRDVDNFLMQFIHFELFLMIFIIFILSHQ